MNFFVEIEINIFDRYHVAVKTNASDEH